MRSRRMAGAFTRQESCFQGAAKVRAMESLALALSRSVALIPAILVLLGDKGLRRIADAPCHWASAQRRTWARVHLPTLARPLAFRLPDAIINLVSGPGDRTPLTKGRGKSELQRARCWITSRRGDPTAQCNREQSAPARKGQGKGETVV